MTARTKPNHRYWQSREGRSYELSHEIRNRSEDASYRHQERWLAERLERTAAARGQSIRLLDFGCGFGRIARLCAELPYVEYFGYDFSLTMTRPLFEAPPARYAHDIGERVRIGRDARECFPEVGFDVILTISVLIHNDEAEARRIVASLAEFAAPDGEIVMIENALSSRTVFSHVWHAGCWSHALPGYAPEGFGVLVDETIHPSHAAYVLARATIPSFVRITQAGRLEYPSAAALLGEAASPSEHAAVAEPALLNAALALDMIETNKGSLPVSDPNVAVTDAYRLPMRHKIIDSFIKSQSFSYSPASYEQAIHEHVEGRFNSFRSGVLPWLKRHVGLNGQRIIEIGSGTGASTLAVAPIVAHVDCFEIHEPSVDCAEFRMKLAGYANHTQHAKPFDARSAQEVAGADGVFMAAVLEHTTFAECIDILRNSWAALKPGGWICVVDTPNRLCPFDHHTAILPFFSALPPEVRMAYAKFSPRPEFAGAFPEADSRSTDARAESLARWGCGISYHEFELALGREVHGWVLADGFEPEINGLIGVLPEDSISQLQLGMFAPHVNRAFARRGLYLIIRKPA
jgi:SAM-dependent methyltransferase